MRKIIGLLVLSVVVAVMFNSCKKNFDNEQYTQTNTPVIPDLTSQITTSVAGFITNENDSAVSGAVITAGTQTATTNQFGYFNISNVSLSKTAAFVTVTYAGYFNGYRTFIAQPGKQSFIRLKLIPKTAIGTINASTGGTATTSDGASVTLPANAVVLENNNTSYTGTIHVAAHWINPADTINLPLNMPGNLLGIDTSGYLKILETFGMLAVELTDGSGNLLQIAPGKQATLSFPIPSALTASAPVSLPLWSFNDTTGLWKQESSATKTGSNYVGNVSHFSYWNCDIGYSPVPFTVQIVDSSLHPLANTNVIITASQYLSYNHGYTDTSGFIYGMVPANADLQLQVYTLCNAISYSKEFTSFNSPIDLGTLVDSNDDIITITGSAVDCNNAPVTNGIALIHSNNQNIITTIQQGSFNIRTALGCIDPNTYITIIDSNGNTQGASQPLNLHIGVNNIVTISACTHKTDVYLTYSIDGGTPAITATIIDYNELGDTGDSTTILCEDPGTLWELYFNYAGPQLIGSYTLGKNFYLEGPLGIYNYNSPFTINITEFGAIGAFISGNFTFVGIPESSTVAHTVTCSFRYRRKY